MHIYLLVNPFQNLEDQFIQRAEPIDSVDEPPHFREIVISKDHMLVA
jgi:hypothetical protein